MLKKWSYHPQKEYYKVGNERLKIQSMQDLKLRTKIFAIDCWKFCKEVPRSREIDAWVRQLIRSSSSVGANYRASQRAKSTADFINKLKIVEEEVDESPIG